MKNIAFLDVTTTLANKDFQVIDYVAMYGNSSNPGIATDLVLAKI